MRVRHLPPARSLVFLGLLVSLLAVPGTASAATGCGVDACPPETMTTPLGTATVTVYANVVTVDFFPPDPIRPFVTALPRSYPPDPILWLGFTRTSLVTAAGTVNIDTRLVPPNPILPLLGTFNGLAVVSLAPLVPMRVSVTRTPTHTTVVFTPRL